MAAQNPTPVGQTFNLLTVLSVDRYEPKNGYYVEARCACGSVKVYRLHYLRNGHTNSCGCLRGAKNKERTIHGHAAKGANTPTWRCYRDMRTRCENPAYPEFALYGGRGIAVCERWRLEGFKAFLADMGEQPPGMTLERRDVNAGYSPENCTWATRDEQANNKRNSRFIELNGKRQTVAQWARELGMLDKTIYFRLAKGYTPEQALSTRLHSGFPPTR